MVRPRGTLIHREALLAIIGKTPGAKVSAIARDSQIATSYLSNVLASPPRKVRMSPEAIARLAHALEVKPEAISITPEQIEAAA